MFYRGHKLVRRIKDLNNQLKDTFMLSEVRIDSLSCNEGSSIIGDSPEKLTIEA